MRERENACSLLYNWRRKDQLSHFSEQRNEGRRGRGRRVKKEATGSESSRIPALLTRNSVVPSHLYTFDFNKQFSGKNGKQKSLESKLYFHYSLDINQHLGNVLSLV